MVLGFMSVMVHGICRISKKGMFIQLRFSHDSLWSPGSWSRSG